MFQRIRNAMHRRWHRKEVRYWGERIEALERARLGHASQVEQALAECAKHKRALAMIDGVKPRVVNYAPGLSPNDGVRRFTLMQDRPAR